MQMNLLSVSPSLCEDCPSNTKAEVCYAHVKLPPGAIKIPLRVDSDYQYHHNTI